MINFVHEIGQFGRAPGRCVVEVGRKYFSVLNNSFCVAKSAVSDVT